jgi:hypothetical protein
MPYYLRCPYILCYSQKAEEDIDCQLAWTYNTSYLARIITIPFSFVTTTSITAHIDDAAIPYVTVCLAPFIPPAGTSSWTRVVNKRTDDTGRLHGRMRQPTM